MTADAYLYGLVLGMFCGAIIGWAVIPCPLFWVRKKLDRERANLK